MCHIDGPSFWTAGQRIDPSTESEFIWRVGSQEAAMTYVNWEPDEPSWIFQGHTESCMQLRETYAYKWNDRPCTDICCAVCEIGM